MNGFTSRVHQLEVGLEGHLKPSSTYHDIKLMHLIVGRKYPLGHDLGDLSIEDWLDVWLHEGLQIAVSRGYPSATRCPLWNDKFLQFFVPFAHPTEPTGVSIGICI